MLCSETANTTVLFVLKRIALVTLRPSFSSTKKTPVQSACIIFYDDAVWGGLNCSSMPENKLSVCHEPVLHPMG